MTERLGRLVHLAARAVLTGTGDGDSLENINTTNLNDGCLCWVTEFQSYYVFVRAETAAATGFAIIAPIAGPGRWMSLVSPTDSENWAAVEMVTTPDDITIGTQSQWENPPSGTGDYALSSPGPDLFVLDTTTGLLTYGGSAGKSFLVSIVASVANKSANAISIEVVADTGVLVGGSNDDFAAGRGITPAAANAEICLTSNKILSLDHGAVLRPVFRNLTNTDDLSVERLSWTVTAVS